MANLLLIAVFIPLLAFTFLVFFGHRLRKPRAGYVAVGGIGLSFVLATIVLFMWLGQEHPVARDVTILAPWATIGSVDIDFGVKVDSLTVIMFFMVTLIATCIFVFSIGYMSGHSDEVDGRCKHHRFFTYLSLFAFSMLGLLISTSLLFLFIFWELVGACSYFLIGFYFHKKSASDAAIKAFVVNRVGDFGFIIGLMIVFFYLGDVSLSGAADQFANSAAEFRAQGANVETFHPREDVPGDQLFTAGPLGITIATWMGICLFCGAMGKSAQVPLQVWLPDAMEGPTPVSALIHAATMVAAGVYLVARIFTLLTPGAAMFIATIGCITLTVAALIAVVQTDIKRVLAYSTVSQLGYMIFGLGVGAWIAALFHLLTHAFFKALMFLGSGQVIEGCHHEQDMRKMGGLRKKMPVTCWTFLIGVLAISGVGLPWLKFGVGGYYSKDEILAVAYTNSFGHVDHAESTHAMLASADPTDVGHAVAASDNPYEEYRGLLKVLCVCAISVAFITPFYMMRCWWLTFMGKPRDSQVYEHAHESKLMYAPLVVLAIGTLISSWFLFRPMVAQAFGASPLGLGFDEEAMHGIEHAAHLPLTILVWPSFIVGFFVAWLLYKNGLDKGAAIKARLTGAHRVLMHKFYFDEVYNRVFHYGFSRVLANVSAGFDKYVIDGVVNLTGWLTRAGAGISGDFLDRNGFGGAQERKRPGLVTLFVILATVAITSFLLSGAYTAALWAGAVLWLLLGVDGLVNDVGRVAWDAAQAACRPQTGRIRMYVLLTAGAAAVAVVVILWNSNGPTAAVGAVLP